MKKFQHTAARRRLVQHLGQAGTNKLCFNTQQPEGGWFLMADLFTITLAFQHTAARRRLGWRTARGYLLHLRFNTQQPEGGWINRTPQADSILGFNTQQPEGGWVFVGVLFACSYGFNTQQPEGGWLLLINVGHGSLLFQHTAARRRLGPLSKALLHQVSQHQFR